VAQPYDLTATAHLRSPGPVVPAGPPGAGRGTRPRAIAAHIPGPGAHPRRPGRGARAGEGVRARIAGPLGVSAETVDPHPPRGGAQAGGAEAAAHAFAHETGEDRR
jgi:hypothetical protein